MDIRRLDLNLLVALDALLDERSVTRAAKKLAMSQPAMSAALHRLRALFGESLFTRAQRGLIPTDRALALAEPIKQILRDAQTLMLPPVFTPHSAQRTLRVATTDYMFAVLLAPLLAYFQCHAPGISLSVHSLEFSDIPARLARGELDFGITVAAFAEADLKSRYLYTDRYIGAVRTGHPILAEPISVEALCRYPHTLVVPTGGVPRGPVDDALSAIGAERRVAIALPSFLGLPYALGDTDLIAIGPERLFTRMSDQLVLFEVPLILPSFDVIAIWHPRAQNDPGHRWVREKLVEITTTALELLG